jgi:UDP-N-acetylmuramyl pentapeptide phosphotransferase/UDP-N-acetylglucosamine-1-phosphate transferase
MRWRRLIGTPADAAVALPAFVGFVAGWIGDHHGCSMLISLCLLGILVLAFGDLIGRLPPDKRTWTDRLSAVALVAYLGFLITPEFIRGRSLLESHSAEGVYEAIAWLSPLLVGGAMAPHRPFERGRWAWWLAVFAGVTIVVHNAVNIYSSVGFSYEAYY